MKTAGKTSNVLLLFCLAETCTISQNENVHPYTRSLLISTDTFFEKKNDNSMPIKQSYIFKWNKLPNDVCFKELSNICLSLTSVYT